MATTIPIAKPGETKIGWIGTGVMGKSMCGHLIKAGYQATVYNRSSEKTKPLVDQGAVAAASPYEVAQKSDVVFTILGYPHDVREVILGKDGKQGVLDGLRPGCVLVDMTTSEPNLAKEIAEAATKRGVLALDAPVSGGDIGAREARLSIMIGGESAALTAVDPLLRLMGQNIRHMGGAGAGQHTKMFNQILISTTMIGVVEGLLYAYKAGLDLEEAIKAVGSGAAGSWSINNYGPRIVQRNFDPGFFVEHFIKDMKIALSESKRMGLNLPGLELALRFYQELESQGHGRKGTHALMLAFEKMNNVEIPKK
jgi:3-hydroxyisobutyrate dehydrogenase